MFDSYDSTEDPDAAQARLFLGELDKHATTLARRLQSAPTAETRQSIKAELSVVRRCMDRIHRRFPTISVPHPSG